MLRQFIGPFVFWCCSEDRKDEGNTSAYGFGTIKNGGGTEPKLLGASCILPAYDRSSVEEDLDTFTGGENRGDTIG